MTQDCKLRPKTLHMKTVLCSVRKARYPYTSPSAYLWPFIQNNQFISYYSLKLSAAHVTQHSKPFIRTWPIIWLLDTRIPAFQKLTPFYSPDRQYQPISTLLTVGRLPLQRMWPALPPSTDKYADGQSSKSSLKHLSLSYSCIIISATSTDITLSNYILIFINHMSELTGPLQIRMNVRYLFCWDIACQWVTILFGHFRPLRMRPLCCLASTGNELSSDAASDPRRTDTSQMYLSAQELYSLENWSIEANAQLPSMSVDVTEMMMLLFITHLPKVTDI